METPAKLSCAAEAALLGIKGQLLPGCCCIPEFYFLGKQVNQQGRAAAGTGWSGMELPHCSRSCGSGRSLSGHTESIWEIGIALLLISCMSLGIIFPYFLFSGIKKNCIDSVPLLLQRAERTLRGLLSSKSCR